MRPSGTEPVMRFFIDMPDQKHVQSAMDDAVSVLHCVPVRL
jgi:phosphomannomutase